MSSVQDLGKWRDSMKRNLRKGNEGLYDGGNGGGNMEQRVARLEADMSEIKADMKVVRADLAELKGKVSMLPGYPGITVIMAMIGGALLVASRLFPTGGP